MDRQSTEDVQSSEAPPRDTVIGGTCHHTFVKSCYATPRANS